MLNHKLRSLQCLSVGDIVIGRVASKRPFGIVVRLTLLEYGCNRDFTDLNIQVVPLSETCTFFNKHVELWQNCVY